MAKVCLSCPKVAALSLKVFGRVQLHINWLPHAVPNSLCAECPAFAPLCRRCTFCPCQAWGVVQQPPTHQGGTHCTTTMQKPADQSECIPVIMPLTPGRHRHRCSSHLPFSTVGSAFCALPMAPTLSAIEFHACGQFQPPALTALRLAACMQCCLSCKALGHTECSHGSPQLHGRAAAARLRALRKFAHRPAPFTRLPANGPGC